MTLLVISPDYASHLLPLATLATAWRDAGERVVVATGPATAGIVDAFGFERVDLQLGRGSNPGVIRADAQPAGEDDALRGFFAATRLGMVETLMFQAGARLNDLLWEPVAKARAVQQVVDRIGPDVVVVDHLAFSARIGLVAGGVPYAGVVLGHPTALPVAGEIYGVPPVWPAAFDVEPEAFDRLEALGTEVTATFTEEWNAALAALGSTARAPRDAFAEHGDTVLFNYPLAFADPDRLVPFAHEYLGSTVRSEPADPEVDDWLAASADPFVYVSFGSFLSVRDDVLARVATAIEVLGLRAAIAVGSGDPAVLGDVPAGWLVREYLPQVTLLGRAAAAVTHGGNNSVTEAATAGVPMLVLPFSTDQFAGAVGVERAGHGVALAPNTATVEELADVLGRVLALHDAVQPLGEALRATPGPRRAYEALVRTSATS